MERTDNWLNERLRHLGATAYGDISDISDIQISFGRNSRNRLGSIKRRKGISQITITGYFKHTEVPDYVIDETIAHELTHYAHGFESPLPRLYRYPHSGGIVTRELVKRGLGNTHRLARAWLKANWVNFLRAIAPKPARQKRRRISLATRWLIRF